MPFDGEQTKIDTSQKKLEKVETVSNYSEIWKKQVDETQTFANEFGPNLKDDTVLVEGLQKISLVLEQAAFIGEKNDSQSKDGVKKLMDALQIRMEKIRKETSIASAPTLAKVKEQEKIGLGRTEHNTEVQEMLDSLKTDQERKEFLDALMISMQESQENELSVEQKLRLQQVELLQIAVSAMANEYSENGKTMAMYWIRVFGDNDKIESQHKKLLSQAEQIKNDYSLTIAQNNDKTLEQLNPQLVKLFKSFEGSFVGKVGYINGIDFSDPKSGKELDQQRVQTMNFCRSLNQYEPVRKLTEDSLHEEFEKARKAVSEKEKSSMKEDARRKIYEMSEEYNKQWTEQGMTHEQILALLNSLVDEEYSRNLTAEALKNFNAENLSEGKKAVWEVYNDTFDPKSEWFTMTDEHFDTILKEVLVNAPLIIVSGGVANLSKIAVSNATKSFLLNSPRIGRVLIGVHEGSQLARIGTGAGLTLVEGASFEVTNNIIAKTFGLEEKWLWEMPDALQRILWSAATLGAFHGAGKMAEGVGKGVDQSLARQVLKFKGVANPEEFKAAIDIVAKEISNNAARKVIQQLVISGNIEASTMLIIGAVQNGYYKGSLKDFFDNFGEELFHAYVTVGALKTSGAATGKVMEWVASSTHKKNSVDNTPKKSPTDRDDSYYDAAHRAEAIVTSKDKTGISENNDYRDSSMAPEEVLSTSSEKATDPLVSKIDYETTVKINNAEMARLESHFTIQVKELESRLELSRQNDFEELQVLLTEAKSMEKTLIDIWKIAKLRGGEKVRQTFKYNDQLKYLRYTISLAMNNSIKKEINNMDKETVSDEKLVIYKERIKFVSQEMYESGYRLDTYKESAVYFVDQNIEQLRLLDSVISVRFNAEHVLESNGNFEPEAKFKEIMSMKKSKARELELVKFRENFETQKLLIAAIPDKVRKFVESNPRAGVEEVINNVLGGRKGELRFSRQQKIEIKKRIYEFLKKKENVDFYYSLYKDSPKELACKIFDLYSIQLPGEILIEKHGATLFFIFKDMRAFAEVYGGPIDNAQEYSGFATQRSEIPELKGTVIIGNGSLVKNTGEKVDLILHEQRHQENKLLFTDIQSPFDKPHEITPEVRASDEIIAYLKEGEDPETIKQMLIETDGIYFRRYFYENNDTVAQDKYHKNVDKLVDIAVAMGYENLDLLSITPWQKWSKLKVPKKLETFESSDLSESARIEKASKLLPGHELTDANGKLTSKGQAILGAHNVGADGTGKYSRTELLQKARILEEAGFSAEERRVLMENGVTGLASRVAEFLGYSKKIEQYKTDETVVVPRSNGDLCFGKIIGLSKGESGEIEYTLRINMEHGRTGIKTLTQSQLDQYNRKYSEGMKVNTEYGEATIVKRTLEGMYEVKMKDGSYGIFGELYLDEFKSKKSLLTETPEAKHRLELIERQRVIKNDFEKVVSETRQPPVTSAILREGWFEVKEVIELSGQTFYFGSVTKGRSPGSYLEAVAFVRIGNQIHPRLFYKSTSDGVWRCAPDKHLNRKGQIIYSKGLGLHYTQETKLATPIDYYLRSSEKNHIMLGSEVGEHFTVTTEKNTDFRNQDKYISEVSMYRHPDLADFMEVQPGHPNISRIRPEAIRSHLERGKYPKDFIPDFKNGYLGKFPVEHTLLGDVMAYKFESYLVDNNGRYPVEWTFMVDKAQRVWISSIRFENAKVSSFGNFTQIIDSGFLTSKAIEYREQAGGLEGRDFVELTPDLSVKSPKDENGRDRYVDQTPLLNAMLPIREFRKVLPYL